MPDDPRRWFTLAVVVTAVLIVAMDNTIITVAIPTIQRDLATDLSSLEWVVTGYSLTFATLLIVGGRLGDVYGARRTFLVGAGTFTVGSLLASLATSVPVLVAGEAVIEGIGASLMMPATLSILSNTFRGRDRATAFAVWGGTAGLAVTLGPALGGFLTTTYSWRWSFRINVVVAPLAMLGALAAFRHDRPEGRRPRIDVPGAVLVAVGMFLLVFALSEGSRYGWWRPTAAVALGGVDVWPADRLLSIVPLAFAGSALALAAFVAVEQAKGRAGRDPLLALEQLHYKTFRYGLITTTVLAMGQLAYVFTIPIFLQQARGLTAERAGLWLVPSGLFIILGSQVGGRLTARLGPTPVVRAGLVGEAVGLLAMASSISAGVTLLSLLPGLALFSAGVGFASSQLTNVILSEIAADQAGSASGANTTVRQIGAALGVAIAGTLLASASSPAAGARTAMLVAAAEVAVGAALSMRIPVVDPAGHRVVAEPASALDPLAPDAAAALLDP